MGASEVVGYTAQLRDRLAALGAPTADLDALVAASATLATLADSAPEAVTRAEWEAAVAQWEAARARVLPLLARAILGPLAGLPVLADLLGDAASIARSGVSGEADVGPVHLVVGSAVLYLQPPRLAGGAPTLPPVPIGPFQVGAIGASIGSPFGGDGPTPSGGGALVRLPDNGWGGRLDVPLPPVLVSASAVLAVEGDVPSFLAVLGVQFVPPIQLSFGFSLDRVGGIIGVNRALATDELRGAIRTGAAGDALFRVPPPADPLGVAAALDRLFPRRTGSHLVGPSLKLSWLSFGPGGQPGLPRSRGRGRTARRPGGDPGDGANGHPRTAVADATSGSTCWASSIPWNAWSASTPAWSTATCWASSRCTATPPCGSVGAASPTWWCQHRRVLPRFRPAAGQAARDAPGRHGAVGPRRDHRAPRRGLRRRHRELASSSADGCRCRSV